MVGHVGVLIRNAKSEVVVADVVVYNLGLLQTEAGRTLPGVGIQNDLIDLAAFGSVARAGGQEIHFRRSADGFVPTQDGQQRGFTFCFVRLDCRRQALYDTGGVLLVANLTGVTPVEVYLCFNIGVNENVYLGRIDGVTRFPCTSENWVVRLFRALGGFLPPNAGVK